MSGSSSVDRPRAMDAWFPVAFELPSYVLATHGCQGEGVRGSRDVGRKDHTRARNSESADDFSRRPCSTIATRHPLSTFASWGDVHGRRIGDVQPPRPQMCVLPGGEGITWVTRNQGQAAVNHGSIGSP